MRIVILCLFVINTLKFIHFRYKILKQNFIIKLISKPKEKNNFKTFIQNVVVRVRVNVAGNICIKAPIIKPYDPYKPDSSVYLPNPRAP